MNSRNARAARRGHFYDSTEQIAACIGYAYQNIGQTYHLRFLRMSVDLILLTHTVILKGFSRHYIRVDSLGESYPAIDAQTPVDGTDDMADYFGSHYSGLKIDD